MDLHPEEAALSGAEDEEPEHSDQDLQIRRTVTQVGRQLLNHFRSASGSFQYQDKLKMVSMVSLSQFTDVSELAGCSISVVLKV